MSQGPSEGYVYPVYGDLRYLKLAVASAVTLRRYDRVRPIALICEEHHEQALREHGVTVFDRIERIASEHRSIVGFKHHVHAYPLFDRTLFLDTDMVWCRNPDPLWTSLSAHRFTITGSLKADIFFGAPKGILVLRDSLLGRRKRTLRRFGLTYLPRVQSGMIYMRDPDLASLVCQTAGHILDRRVETHFQSRTKESGRTLESCEWSLAMAMSTHNVPVYPWLSGLDSPQLDYISDLTEHDADFEQVRCRFHTDPFIYSLRGLKQAGLRTIITKVMSVLPGKGDFMMVTPYVLHFGWYHQKRPMVAFADRVWDGMATGG